MRKTLPLLSLIAACAPQPEVPRAVSLGPAPLAAQIRAQRPEGCAGQGAGGWFAAVCPEALTPGVVAPLQRALAARGLYRGPVTGRMDGPTRAAVAAWQGPRGLDSETLSIRAAQELGVIPWLD
ncbi:peptidoglycan-binding domain-containing protein [Paenirhodobacter sp.]|uniref:peptidoglycan-binding domain-containing protein n=1 Tax=Paenirhodobacter sp. TaxID=1965326 RepID=UPI003B3F95E2